MAYVAAIDALLRQLRIAAAREGHEFEIRPYRGDIQDRDSTIDLAGAVRGRPHILVQFFPGDFSPVASEPSITEVNPDMSILCCATSMRSEEEADTDAITLLEFVIRTLTKGDMVEADAAGSHAEYQFYPSRPPTHNLTIPELTVYEVIVGTDNFMVDWSET